MELLLIRRVVADSTGTNDWFPESAVVPSDMGPKKKKKRCQRVIKFPGLLLDHYCQFLELFPPFVNKKFWHASLRSLD